MENLPPKIKLDELDLALARELELDARQSIRSLAKKLGTSDTTVSRRLQALLDERVINIVAIAAAAPLGLKTSVLMGLNISPGRSSEAVQCLRSFSNVTRIMQTAGCYDIIVSTIFQSPGEVRDFVDTQLSRINGLVVTEKFMLFENIKSSWKHLSDNTERYRPPSPRVLDKLDLSLIQELRVSPRATALELGRKLGVNRALAGKRLRALLADNILRVVSVAKPSFFGLNVHIYMFVKIRPGQIGAVANGLVSEKRIQHITLTTGRFEVLIGAAFRDMDELSDFVENRLGSYPGVISQETLTQVALTPW